MLAIKVFLSVLVIISSVAITDSTHALTFDFSTGLDGFSQHGNATYVPQYAQLTSTGGVQKGSIFLNDSYFASKFTASFDFFIGGGSGADGLTFAWVQSPGVGDAGGWLGFSNPSGTGLSGYMVEFDTHPNTGWEPASFAENHIAVSTTVTSYIAANTIAVDEMETSLPIEDSNGWHHADIAFNNGHIEVYMDYTKYIDHTIASYTAFDAYFGFTAGTWGADNYHLIDNFNFNPIPEPTTILLFGTGLIGLAGARRKIK